MHYGHSRRSDDNSLDLRCLASSHHIERALNGGLDDERFLLGGFQGEWGGSVHYILASGNGILDRLLVQEVGLDQFELIEVVAEGGAKWANFGLVLERSDCASHLEASIFKEGEAGLSADVAGHAGDGDEWLGCWSFWHSDFF